MYTQDPEYKQYLKSNTNFVENLTSKVSSTDERLDYTNYLLQKLVNKLSGVSNDQQDDIGTTKIVLPNRDSFIHGSKTLSAASTAEQIMTSSIKIPDGYAVTIIAKPGNAGIIYIGKSKGDTESTQRFDGLDAGLAISLHITDINLIWVAASVAGDGVSWIVEK